MIFSTSLQTHPQGQHDLDMAVLLGPPNQPRIPRLRVNPVVYPDEVTLEAFHIPTMGEPLVGNTVLRRKQYVEKPRDTDHLYCGIYSNNLSWGP